MLNNAGVIASTGGRGDAGQVRISAYDSIVVDDSFITSAVNTNAEGDSDGIVITTDNLSILNGGVVTASTFAQGDSGQVEINVSSELLVDGEGSFIGSQIEPNATGNSRGVIITTPNLDVLNNGEVSSATFGQGTAGPILLQSNNDLTISLTEGSSITAETLSSARGGDLTIRTDEDLTLQGSGELTVESTGSSTGAVGDFNVFARSVLLNDGVELSAQTASVEGGGDINFFVDETLILRRESFINAESTNATQGSASNIDIEAGFVIAVPTENSDIIANAIGGNGGFVNITTNRLLGFTEQNDFISTSELRANNSSDISASSQFGEPGEINTVNLEPEPDRGLVELPTLSPSPQVQRGCSAATLGTSSFTVTGRGGLPPSPTDILSRDRTLADLGPETEASASSTDTVIHEPENEYPDTIVEAQGAVMDTNGQVTFLAQASDPTLGNNGPQPLQCSGATTTNL